MAPAPDTHVPTTIEARIEELARRQHGVVSRTQLVDLGATASWIDGRVRRRRLRPLHRGVYLVGPLKTPYTRPMAALLAGGPGAAVGYRSAGALWGLTPVEPNNAPVHVLVIGSDRGRVPGLRPHRVEALPPDEVTELRGIRLTTPARTLLDLGGDSTARQLAQAVARAERRNLLERDALRRITARHPTRPGVGALRAVLDGEQETAFTRSMAEERFLRLVRRARLPKPEVNVVLEGLEVDFLWRRRRLVVEVDGFAFHSSRQAFERDRFRDATLTAAGFRVFRLTWRRLESEPEAVAARLAEALARSPHGRRG